MLQLKLRATLGYSTSGAGLSIPFLYDADTYWWDFKSSGNDIETFGDDTMSYAPERIANVKNALQLVKSDQPLVDANGINFYGTTANTRRLTLENVSGLANGKTGLYGAAIIKVDSVAQTPSIFSISKNGNASPSRLRFGVTGSRNITVQSANADGTTLTTVGYAAQVTLGQWYVVEFRWTRNPNTLEIWYNGVAQTLVSGPTGTFDTTFTASDPLVFAIGNASTSTPTQAFDGAIKSAVFYNGVPSNAIRQSISDYLVSIKP